MADFSFVSKNKASVLEFRMPSDSRLTRTGSAAVAVGKDGGSSPIFNCQYLLTDAYSDSRQKQIIPGIATVRQATNYFIFARMPSISSLRKARMVWVLTLPREPSLRVKAVTL